MVFIFGSNQFQDSVNGIITLMAAYIYDVGQLLQRN